MDSIVFTDEELSELLWIIDNLVLSATSSYLTDSGKIVSASVSILSPAVLISLYRKLNPCVSDERFNYVVSKLESLTNGK